VTEIGGGSVGGGRDRGVVEGVLGMLWSCVGALGDGGIDVK